MTPLLRGEAVDQAEATRAAQVVLAAAAVGAARGMRRVPRLRRGVVAQALAITVAEHGRALRAAGPVAAGAVLAGRGRLAVGLRAGQHIVVVGGVADAGHHVAALGQPILHAELVVFAVQIVDVLRPHLRPSHPPPPPGASDRAGRPPARRPLPGCSDGRARSRRPPRQPAPAAGRSGRRLRARRDRRPCRTPRRRRRRSCWAIAAAAAAPATPTPRRRLRAQPTRPRQISGWNSWPSSPRPVAAFGLVAHDLRSLMTVLTPIGRHYSHAVATVARRLAALPTPRKERAPVSRRGPRGGTTAA